MSPKSRAKIHTVEVRIFTRAEIEEANKAQDIFSGIPFPSDVVSAVARLDNDLEIDFSTDRDQELFVDRILELAKASGAGSIYSIVRYLRYIRSVFRHCEFVDRYFPDRNTQREFTAKDINCKASSTMEMLSIAHHLYVLKSAGVKGSFAEFGCFKGFSTAKLSYACSLLKIPMLVFDSFEGLPPSSSEFYKAGDFAGSIDEVRDNVKSFGAIDSVTFHKGFFSDSLKRVNIPPLMTIWMDVDLFSSATDVMTIANNLNKHGAIFSHECTAVIFWMAKSMQGRQIRRQCSAANYLRF